MKIFARQRARSWACAAIAAALLSGGPKPDLRADSGEPPSFLVQSVAMQKKTQDLRETLNEILTDAREQAKKSRSARVSKASEELFLEHLPELTQLWRDATPLEEPESDLAVLCEAIQVQRLALIEASTVARCLALRLGSRELTDVTRSLARLEGDLLGLHTGTLARLGRELSDASGGGSELTADRSKRVDSQLGDYVEIERRSASISQGLLESMERAGVAGVSSLTDRQADDWFRPALSAHRSLRLAMGNTLDGNPALSEADYARVTTGIRHAADSAVYLAYRLNAVEWLDIVIRLLRMEAAYGPAIVSHLSSDSAREFWLSDDGYGK